MGCIGVGVVLAVGVPTFRRVIFRGVSFTARKFGDYEF